MPKKETFNKHEQYDEAHRARVQKNQQKEKEKDAKNNELTQGPAIVEGTPICCDTGCSFLPRHL